MNLTIISGIMLVVCLTFLAIGWRQELQRKKQEKERVARRAPNEMRKRFAQLKDNPGRLSPSASIL